MHDNNPPPGRKKLSEKNLVVTTRCPEVACGDFVVTPRPEKLHLNTLSSRQDPEKLRVETLSSRQGFEKLPENTLPCRQGVEKKLAGLLMVAAPRRQRRNDCKVKM